MKYRRLGKNGLRVSEISLGAWLTYGGSVEEQNSIDCIHEAINQGINFIDVADVYSKGNAEIVVGKALAEETYERKNLVVSSKVFWPFTDNPNDVGLSRKHIMDSIENTLDRFGMDYIDIYYCHRFDWKTPLRETIEAMSDLVQDGRIRYWGTSVWSAANLERAVGIAKEIGARLPAVEQPRYNMIFRHVELEVMESCAYHGIGITPWSPLAQGVLTGKYNDGTIPSGARGETSEVVKRELVPEKLEKLKAIEGIAKELGYSMSQLALAWILRRKEISSVITGATKVSQIHDNIKAVDIELSKDTLDQIDEILQNQPKWAITYDPQMMNRD